MLVRIAPPDNEHVRYICCHDHRDNDDGRKLQVVRYLVQSHGAPIEATNDRGETPLHVACQSNCNSMSTTSSASGWKKSSVDVVKYLVQKCKANVEARDNEGATPLHWACRNTCSNVKLSLDGVRCLMEKGKANVAARDNKGATPLHWACRTANWDIVHCLMEKGKANVAARDNKGATALHWACRTTNRAIVQYLVEKGHADVEAQDEEGYTPLHYAVLGGVDEDHQRVVRYLIFEAPIKSRANLDTKSKSGQTPLDLAHSWKRWNNAPMVCLLMHHEQGNDGTANTVTSAMATTAAQNMYNTLLLSATPVQKSTTPTIFGTITTTTGAAAKTTSTSESVPNLQTIAPTQQQQSLTTTTSTNPSPQPMKSDFSVATTTTSSEESAVAHLPVAGVTVGATADGIDSSVLERIQQEAQRLEDLLTKVVDQLPPSVSSNDHQRPSSSSPAPNLLDYGIIQTIIAQKCATEQEEREKREILANPDHVDFYLFFNRKLYSMIAACEGQSTGMLASGETSSMRSMVVDLLQATNGKEMLANTRVGQIVAQAAHWAARQVGAIVPFADAVASLFRVIVSLRDDRSRHLAVANVADAATVLSLENDNNLRHAVERLSRLLVRARHHYRNDNNKHQSAVRVFPVTTEARKSVVSTSASEQFGIWKQRFLCLLGESCNTPGKEEGCLASDAALACLMSPQKGSLLHATDAWRGSTSSMTRRRRIDDSPSFVECWAADLLALPHIDELYNFSEITSCSSDAGLGDFGGTLRHGEHDDASDGGFRSTGVTSVKAAQNSVPFSHVTSDLYASRCQVDDLHRTLRLRELELKRLAKDVGKLMADNSMMGSFGGLTYADYREAYRDRVVQNEQEIGHIQQQTTLLTDNVAVLHEKGRLLEEETECLRQELEAFKAIMEQNGAQKKAKKLPILKK
eukprot:scaffold482_cov266-Amphora_coffeaeformis.AAC.49